MKIKKLLCVILSAFICAASLSGVSLNISALSISIPDMPLKPPVIQESTGVKSGIFSYALEELGKGYTFNRSARYYYSDSYFSEPAENYNSHLATMSMCLAISAFSVVEQGDNPNYEEQSRHVVSLFGKIGFADITPNDDMYVKPTAQTMGAVAARKTMSDSDGEYTLVALALRGGTYGSEWAGNLNVGTAKANGGNHQGFYEARDKAASFLSEYISDISGRVKFWVVGYSRAAAVAGLVGAWLDDNSASLANGNLSFTLHDVYTYTFEAPSGTAKENTVDKNYSNIHNVVGANDLVTKVAMSGASELGWDFVRVGETDIYSIKATPDRTTDALYEQRRTLMIGFLRNMNPDIVSVRADVEDEVFNAWHGASLNEVLNYLSKRLAEEISREEYVLYIEPFVCDVLEQVLSDQNSQKRFIDAAKNLLDKYTFGRSVSFIGELSLNKETVDLIIKNKEAIKPVLIVAIKDLLSSAGVTYNEGELMSFMYAFLDIFSQRTTDIVYSMLVLFTQDEPGFFANHYPELPLAWLMASDSYYGGIEADIAPAVTREVTVSGASFSVLDSKGDVLFSSADSADATCAIKVMRSENKTVIYLPSNASYKIKLSSYGLTEYSVNEYCIVDGEYKRRVSYSEIDASGEDLVAEIPELSRGKTASYTLAYESGEQIAGSDSLSEEIRTVNVSATVDNVMLSGGGKYFVGERAAVYVNDAECHTFLGWYKADMLLSTDRSYSFTVTDSVEITARFADSHTPSDWIVDTEAKVGVEGSEHIECTVCGITIEQRKIPAKTESVTEIPEPEEDEPKSSILPIFIVCFSVVGVGSAVAVLIAVRRYNRRKK